MPFLDTIQSAALRVLPEKKPTLPMPASTTGGIGSAGVVPFEDDVSACLARPYTLYDVVACCLRVRERSLCNTAGDGDYEHAAGVPLPGTG